MLEEDIVLGSLGEDVDGADDRPAASAQGGADRLPNVVVSEERESPLHYVREWFFRYSSRARTPSLKVRSCSAYSVLISSRVSSA